MSSIWKILTGGSRVGSSYLAEYDFEICYPVGRDNACADFLSRPVELLVIDDNQPFETNLNAIARQLDNLSVVDESISIKPESKKRAKDFLVHDENYSAALSTGSGLYPT